MEYKNKLVADIVNGLSINFPCSKYDFDLKQCYNDIIAYCHGYKKRPPQLKKVDIKNGFLYIDGVKLNKVVYKLKYNNYSCLTPENAIDYENLILSRQENADF